MRMIPITVISGIAVALLAGCSSSPAEPAAEKASAAVHLTSCGLNLTIDHAPERAITLEQGATEVMLALGLEDSMVGTSYLTDAVAPEFSASYAKIPVLADQYPTAEHLREANPDFVYSMRSSAFASDAAGARSELNDLGVPAYLSSNDCEDPKLISQHGGFEQIFAEVTDIASIFDVADRGADLVASQQRVLDSVNASAKTAAGLKVVWVYSTINGAPIVAGNAGLAQTMTELTGAENAFSDLNAQWTETSWDEIAQRNPDVLVLADLSRGLDGDSAADKIETLRAGAVTRQLTAVQKDQLVAIPATELDPSVRSIDALATLSAALIQYAGGAR